MPCNSDYMEPSGYEKEITKTVNNLVYVHNKLGVNTPNELAEAYKKSFFTRKEGDKWVARLCSMIRGLSESQINDIVYNARSSKSRRLADWWDEHEAADKKREAKEQAKTKINAVIEKINETQDCADIKNDNHLVSKLILKALNSNDNLTDSSDDLKYAINMLSTAKKVIDNFDNQ